MGDCKKVAEDLGGFGVWGVLGGFRGSGLRGLGGFLGFRGSGLWGVWGFKVLTGPCPISPPSCSKHTAAAQSLLHRQRLSQSLSCFGGCGRSPFIIGPGVRRCSRCEPGKLQRHDHPWLRPQWNQVEARSSWPEGHQARASLSYVSIIGPQGFGGLWHLRALGVWGWEGFRV